MDSLKNIFLIAALLTLILPAASITINTSTETVINNETKIDLNIQGCEDDDDLEVGVEGPYSNDSIEEEFDNWNGTGEYNFTAECKNGDDEETDTHSIVFDEIKASGLGLENDVFEIDSENAFDLSLESEADALNSSNIDSAEIKAGENSLYNSTEDSGSFQQEFNVETDDWSLADEEALNVYLDVSNAQNSSENRFESEFNDIEFSRYRLELQTFRLSDQNVSFDRFSRGELGTFEIVANVYDEKHEGADKTGLIEEDFTIESETGPGEIDLRSADNEGNDGENPYVAKLSALPRMDSSRETFSLKLDEPSNSIDFTVYTGATFEGNVYNNENQPVDIVFSLDDPEKEFETDTSGFFTQTFSDPVIDRPMKIEFPRAELKVSEKDIGFQREENIYYNFYEEPDNLGLDLWTDEIKPVNIVGFETRYPVNIDDAELVLDYSTSGIDASEIRLYECGDWDLFGDNCRTSWDEITIDSNQEVWGELETDDLSTVEDGSQGISSAYMVAVDDKNEDMVIDQSTLDFNENQINIDDFLTVEGTLISNQTKEPVQDADVKIELAENSNATSNNSIDKIEIPSEGNETNQQGEFTKTMDEPFQNPGEYNVTVEASKEGFNLFEAEWEDEITVYQDKELTLTQSNDEQIILGDRSTIALNLENTGQSPLENISIYDEEINDRHYSKNLRQIDLLEPGEDESLTINYLLPKDYCENNNCENPISNIEAETSQNNQTIQTSHEIKLHSNFTGSQQLNETSDQDQETETEEVDDGSFASSVNSTFSAAAEQASEAATIEDEEDVLTALILMASITVIAIIIKDKKKNNRRSKLPRKEKIMGKTLQTTIEGDESHYLQIKYGNGPRNTRSDKNSSKYQKEQVKRKQVKRSNSSLEQIENKIHKNNGVDQAEKACSECGSKFHSKQALKIHKDRKHVNQRTRNKE